MLKYYIEFVHENSDAENYDMQSKFFDTPKEAKAWLHNSFDFIDKAMRVFLMTVEFEDDDSYDIIESKRIKH